MKEKEQRTNWPDEIRLAMIEKSRFYGEDKIYHYGYYDGYQKAIQRLKEKGIDTDALTEAVKLTLPC